MKPVVLTIAGSDPSAGSGIQLDLKTLAAWDCHGVSAITAVTVQSSERGEGVGAVDADLVRRQIELMVREFPVAAVKVGMLATAETVQAVSAALRDTTAPVVCDPVLRSSSGMDLLDPAAHGAWLDEMLPLASLVTPNAEEAATLTGQPVRDADEAERAGRTLRSRGAAAVLVKGGHLTRDRGIDVLVRDAGTRRYPASTGSFPATRGTGCMLASSVAALLARGCSLARAVEQGRAFVARAAQAAPEAVRGPRIAQPAPWMASGTPVPLGRLHVVSDTTFQQAWTHAEIAALAAAGGADAVQFREKRATTTRERIDTARAMRQALDGYDSRLIVNDRADVCVAADAHGLHVGRDDLQPDRARRIVGAGRWIGGTANDLQEAIAVAAQDVDYLGVGPVFGTRSKQDPARELGLDGLREIVRSVAQPVIAIGSIDANNVAAVMATGVHGVAVLSSVVCADDPRDATARIRDAMGQEPMTR